MKWIIRLIGIVLLLIVIAIGGLLLLPADQVGRLAADQLRNATGREVAFSGGVSVSLWPTVGVTARGIEVANADWASPEPMITAAKAAIGVDTIALLRGEIRVKNVEAINPTIRLEQRADGRANWQFSDAGEAQSSGSASGGAAAPAFWIERLAVTKATLIYTAEGADTVTYSDMQLALAWPDQGGSVTVEAALQPAGTPIKVSARIDAFEAFLGGDTQPISVNMRAANGSTEFTGRANVAGDLAGTLALKLSDTDAFLQGLGLPPANLPPKLGRSVDASTEITLTDGANLSLRALSADLGGNAITGETDIAFTDVPQITGRFDLGSFDLSALTGQGGSGSTQSASASGWDKSPIDASALAQFNGEVELRAQHMNFGTFKIGATHAVLRNDNARAVFELRNISAYEGTVAGEFVVNNRNGLSVGGNLRASGIGLQPLLTDMAGISRLTGNAEARLQFLGVGASVHAIMNSLSGAGSVEVGRGTIQGIDLDQLMRSGQPGSGTTVFDSLGMSFTMKDGNLFNEDLLLALSSYEARGKGRVGLGAQDLDYTFTPIALNANAGTGIAIPVRIRGPWSAPSILPDIEAAIDLGLSAEKEALKDAAESALRDRVQEGLGTAGGGQKQIEEVVKDKLEKELGGGILKLFD